MCWLNDHILNYQDRMLQHTLQNIKLEKNNENIYSTGLVYTNIYKYILIHTNI